MSPKRSARNGNSGNDSSELPVSISSENAVLYLERCLNNYYKKYSPREIFELIGKIIRTFGGSQDLGASISNKVQKIILMCISSSYGNDIESLLDCLEIILIKYGNASFLLKPKISSYLERFLGSSLNLSIITKAGNDLHLLQQVGSAGKNASTHKKQWLDYINVLCKSMHALYDEFFANVKEYTTYNIIEGVLAYDFLIQSHLDNKQVAQKLRNITVFIKCALLKQFPHERSLQFQNLFNVIKRGLLVDEYSQDSTHAEEFLCLLYTLQINLLYLLKTLLNCGKPGIRKYSEEILKLLVDCLKRTDKPYFSNKSIFQTTLYSVLNEFITLEKENLSSSACETILSHNFKYILSITNPSNASNTFEEVTHTEISIQLSHDSKKLTVTNSKCKEAMATIYNLLHYAVAINEDKLDVLYKFIMDHLVRIRNGYSIQPYPGYTMDLYKVLNALRTLPNYCSFSLLSCSIEMLSNDYTNKNDSISQHGLEAIENLVNPMYPSLTIIKTNSADSGKNLCIANESSITNFFKCLSNSNVDNINTIENDEPPLKQSRFMSDLDITEKGSSVEKHIVSPSIEVNITSTFQELNNLNSNETDGSESDQEMVTDKSMDTLNIIKHDNSFIAEPSQHTDRLSISSEIEIINPRDETADIKVPIATTNDLNKVNNHLGQQTDNSDDETQLESIFCDTPNEEFF